MEINSAITRYDHFYMVKLLLNFQFNHFVMSEKSRDFMLTHFGKDVLIVAVYFDYLTMRPQFGLNVHDCRVIITI